MTKELSMTTEQVILQQQKDMQESIKQMADGISQLTTTLAKVEVRHATHDDGMRRMGKQLDSIDNRLRVLESSDARIKGAWKVALGIFAIIGVVAGIAAELMG